MISGAQPGGDFAVQPDQAGQPLRSADGPALLEINGTPPLTSVRFPLLILLATAFSIAVFVFVVGPLGATKTGGYVGLAATILLLIGLMRWRQTGDAARIRRGIAGVSDGELRERLREVVGRPWTDGRKLLQALAAQLAADGRRGLTVRFAPRAAPPTPPPMEQPFEPEPLGDVRSVRAWLTGDDPGPQNEIRRSVLRNIRLKGGWALVVIFAINFAMACVEAWQIGRPTIPVLCWAFGLASVLFLPILGGAAGQWLVAPAALIFRPRRWLSPAPRRLFARPGSVLLAGWLRRELWGFAVSDGESCQVGYGTREDIDALLCAWLSPLPPPDPARISDLE